MIIPVIVPLSHTDPFTLRLIPTVESLRKEGDSAAECSKSQDSIPELSCSNLQTQLSSMFSSKVEAVAILGILIDRMVFC